jgi:rubredoxin
MKHQVLVFDDKTEFISEFHETRFRSWLCVVCGFIYNEQDGMPDEGIPPGTRWKDVPDEWRCSECGAGKTDFEMVEI